MSRKEELLTVDELAECLRVKPRTVNRWSRQGLIPSVRLTRKVIRYDLNAVVGALQAGHKAKEGAADAE